MKRQIRSSVFETNSSSTHSIAISKKNPLKALITMLPAYVTALGTQSSAATIPVTLKQTIKNGVDEKLAGFTVPLCATIHLAGSTLKIVACALAILWMQGMPHGLEIFAGFICMLGITMVAAPGVPGGAIMAALGLLSSMLGFNEDLQGLMIALYIAMDTFGIMEIMATPTAIVVSMNSMEQMFRASRLPCRGIPPMVKNTALANNVWVVKMAA